MNIETYADELDNYGFYSSVIDEMCRNGGCSTDLMLRITIEKAKESGVELTGIDDFDYEDFFYTLYDCSEKGLS